MYKEEKQHSWSPQSKAAFSLEVVNVLSVTWVTWEGPTQFRPCLNLLSGKGQQWISRTWQKCHGISWNAVLESHGFCSEAFLESSNTLHFITFKAFHFSFTCTLFLYTAALPEVRARSLLALHVLLKAVCICALYPSPCHVFFRLKGPSLFCHSLYRNVSYLDNHYHSPVKLLIFSVPFWMWQFRAFKRKVQRSFLHSHNEIWLIFCLFLNFSFLKFPLFILSM